MVFSFCQWFVLFVVLVAGFCDLLTGKIPNRLTYSTAVVGLVLNGMSTWLPAAHLDWLGLIGIESSMAGFLLVLLVMMAIHLTLGVGAGDVKLCAAVSALIGPTQGLSLVCYGYLLAACASVAILALKLGPARILQIAWITVNDTFAMRRRPVWSDDVGNLFKIKIPLGVYFALAMPLVLLDPMPSPLLIF